MTAPAARMVAEQRCRFCGCTPENPCRTEFGDECSFLGRLAARCSSKPCILAADRERETRQASRKALDVGAKGGRR